MRLLEQVEAKIMPEDDTQALPANVFPFFSRSGVQGDANKKKQV